MRQSNRFDAARAVAAVLLAIGVPTLGQTAETRSDAPLKPPLDRSAPRTETPRLSPVLEFVAQTIGTEQEALASPHEPPGNGNGNGNGHSKGVGNHNGHTGGSNGNGNGR